MLTIIGPTQESVIFLLSSVQGISREAPIPIFIVENEEKRVFGAQHIFDISKKITPNVKLIEVNRYTGEIRAIYRNTTVFHARLPANNRNVEVDLPKSGVVLLTDDGSLRIGDRGNCTLIVDALPSNTNLLEEANAATLNADQALEIVGMDSLPLRESLINAGIAIMSDYLLDALVITMGAQGALLFLEDGSIYHVRTEETLSYKPGVGDALNAGFAVGFEMRKNFIDALLIGVLTARSYLTGEVSKETVTNVEVASRWLRKIK